MTPPPSGPPHIGDPATYGAFSLDRAADRQLAVKNAEAEAQQSAIMRQKIGEANFTLQQKQQGLNRLMGEPGSEQRKRWDALPGPIQAAYNAEAAGMNAAPMAGAMSFPHLISNNSLGESAPPGTLEYGTSEPVKKGERYRVMMMPLTGEEMWQRLAPNTIVTPTATGTQITNKYSGQAVAPVQNSIPPAALLPTTSSSTQTSPGAAPVTTTTTRRKVLPSQGPPALTPPPSGTGGAPRGTSSLPAGLKLRARQVENGDISLPTGRDGEAISQYLAEQGKQIPTPLSAVGAANVQRVDAVLSEIDDVEKSLKSIKGNPNLAADYLKYKHNLGDTPYDELFTKISFEGLRSAAAALQGNNSRAYAIVSRAFQHVPNLDRLGGLNPDSVPRMLNKMSAMRDVLQKTRQTVLQDERKSGVPMPQLSAPPSSGTVKMTSPDGKEQMDVPADQVSHYESIGAKRK
jgi:hypothetical protein